MYSGCFDISHYQGTIKWSLVKQAGYSLVFIKATQGTRFVDPRFVTNADGAKDAGLMVVPYHFLNKEPGDLQAAHFAATAKLKHGDAVMVDWESDTPEDLPPTLVVETFISSMRVATNRPPLMYYGIYTRATKAIVACPWHVPKYGPQPARTIKWLFWQDSRTGHIPGVAQPCDHDQFVGTPEELEAWFKTGKLPAALETKP